MFFNKMFFKKKEPIKQSLSDFVEKVTDSGFVFTDINNDLGNAVEDGADDWPPLMLMAYAYARRVAASALYVQGVVDHDFYDYVKAFFKGMQVRTGHTVEFQEKAFDAAVDYMKTYNPAITKIFIRQVATLAEEYEPSDESLSDSVFFKTVVEMLHLEEREKISKNQAPKYELTCPFEPEPELQSQQGLSNYLTKLSKLERSMLYVEFANVRAAKHNLLLNSSGRQKSQILLTDLTDKSVAICVFAFGEQAVFGYDGGNLRSFNSLVDRVDEIVASQDLEPEQHGHQLLTRLQAHLIVG